MLNQILNLGIHQVNGTFQVKRLRLINSLALLNITINLIGIVYLLFVEITSREQLFHSFFTFSIHFLFLYLNHKGKIKITYLLLRIFMVCSTLAIFLVYDLDLYTKILFGFGAFGFVNVISDSKKEIKIEALVFLLIISVGSYLQLSQWYTFIADYNYENNVTLQFASVFLIGLTLYYSFSLKTEAISYYNELEKAIETNHQQNRELQQTVEDKALLVTEINHRVKNNLELILSILELQLDKVKDSKTQRSLLVGISRIKSMASLHQLLNEKVDYTAVGIKPYLENLTSKILELHPEQQSLALETSLCNYNMHAQEALALGLIFNEVITNSIQHAKSSTGKNIFQLESKLTQSHFILSFKDNGNIQTLNFKENLGHKLIQLLTKQLQAELTREIDNGLKTTLKLKRKQP
ncbi:Two-component sensor histidine kinase, contains HisKA and HATPase domains [Lishizhenia tianjinensis]|uniref:histidine kinase n=1 Tax=Lishizhenia tianjinensis TaxID=477690 RepID=A0A1I7B4J4_9FLAO|nr:Two-component sensor histidine kinase, contains HisKA and HATPase domains [Lishizhenia tianjinensis]